MKRRRGEEEREEGREGVDPLSPPFFSLKKGEEMKMEWWGKKGGG